jgi:hypothetical protein
MLATVIVSKACAGDFDEPPMMRDGMPTAFGLQSETRTVSGGTREAYRVLIRGESLRAGLPPEIADAIIEVESGYRPDAIGTAGEVGMMQVMPSTARMLGFFGTPSELARPEINIHYGVTYLAQAWRLADRDLCTAAMKYRAGHGETRFSFLSVEYCMRVRAKLVARGYPVTGTVPQATFGFLERTGSKERRRTFGRHNPDLNGINNRLQAIANAASSHTARIVLR